jgi:hypothetical protein
MHRAQVFGESTAGGVARARPRRGVMENLKDLKTGPSLDVGGGIVCGCLGHAVGLGLNVAPAKAIPDPIDSGQRGQVGELCLPNGIIPGKPGDGRVEADR